MNITFLSDTHGLHRDVAKKSILDYSPYMDVVIHAGDITEYGSEDETLDFLQWFGKWKSTYKIFIGGNHDLFLASCTPSQIRKLLPKGVIYLNNSGVSIGRFNFWGSPNTPYHLGMAFNLREKALHKGWDKIPNNTDILITHCPPKGIMDNGIGCEALLNKVKDIKPIYHVFGHAHGHYNNQKLYDTNFFNAALVFTKDYLNSDEQKLIAKPTTQFILKNDITDGMEEFVLKMPDEK